MEKAKSYRERKNPLFQNLFVSYYFIYYHNGDQKENQWTIKNTKIHNKKLVIEIIQDLKK